MLGNILKIAEAGVLAFSAKKIYELIQDKKQESSESEEYWENNGIDTSQIKKSSELFKPLQTVNFLL
jgi:hypothetical protein